MSDLDAIIIGGGHNGLTCAAYLGMTGLRVRVFERRGVVTSKLCIRLRPTALKNHTASNSRATHNFF